MNRFLYLSLLLLISLSACEKKRFYTERSAVLSFSHDTVYFDTVFTELGTSTKELRIINSYDRWLKIDRIYIAGGADTPFRLNLDGQPGISFSGIEIPPSDSLFIFIDAIINPNNEDNPVLVNDSIIFQINDNTQDINLIAWGQDIHLIDTSIIHTSTWTEGKPYVIYSSVLVDTGHVLTITEGAEVLFHRNTTMYVAGRLIASGSIGKPVLFSADRTESMYEDVPGQWQGLYFLNGSSDNLIMNATVRNAVSAIHAGNLGSADPPPDIEIINTVIAHNSVSGLSSLGSTISAKNMLVFHCGYYCAYLALGGEYSFIHCTMANQWDYSNRTSPLLYVSDYYSFNDQNYTSVLEKAVFINSTLTGNLSSEVFIDGFAGADLNISFRSCLMNIEKQEGADFQNCIINEDPVFISWNDYDFRPDTLSPLIDRGSVDYSDILAEDIRGYSRLIDQGPDIGAFERKPGENELDK